MNGQDPRELERLLRELPADAWGNDPPAAERGEEDVDYETLLAYRAGRLDGAESARVRRALVADPALAEALLILDEVEGEDEPEAGLEAPAAPIAAEERQGMEAAWDRFEARLAPGPAPGPVPVPVPDAPPSPVAPPSSVVGGPWSPAASLRSAVIRQPLSALAAMFVLACGLGLLLGELRRPDGTGGILFEELRIGLDAGPTRGPGPGRGAPETLELPPTVSEVWLTLDPPPSLELEADLPEVAEFLFFEGERQRVRGTAFLQDEGIYALRLPADALGEGRGRVELWDPDRPEPIAVYPFEVRRIE